MTSAEKQRAYRRRKAVESIAKAYFNGRQYLTVAEFREALDFDEDEFWRQLEGYGEEKDEITERRQELWNEAYEKAYGQAYEEVYGEAYERAFKKAYKSLGASEEVDDDDEETKLRADEVAKDEAEDVAKEHAEEVAKSEAEEAVELWEEELDEYDETCWEYALADLLDAQRAASVPPLG